MSIRRSTVAAAVALSLLCMTDGIAGTPPALRADVPGTAAPPTSAPAAAKPAPAPPAAPSGDAAAKHAKRTACLKAAKTNKLVGDEKAAFLKNCIAAR